jgi:hypothetical protein
VFGSLETAGEFANPTGDGYVGLNNVIAAADMNDEVGRCAHLLEQDDFAHFSAIATADGPRPALDQHGLTHAELELFRDGLHDCLWQMGSATDGGWSIAALLSCGQSKTVTTKPTASPG